MLYLPAKLLCMFLFNLRIIPIVVEGRENIKGSGPFIVASNHTDGADGAVTLWCLPFRFWFGLRDDYGQPVRFLMIRFLKTALINREKIKPSQGKKIIRILRSGQSLLLFPQGTRSLVLDKAKPGIGGFSSKNQVPVLPMSITGTENIIRKGFVWQMLRAFLRLRPPIKVVIHAPIICQKGENDQEFTDKVMRTIASGLNLEQRGCYAAMPSE